MPIYEYQCGKCGHEFEREQRIVEDPIKKCPKCRSLQAKRLISRTSFVLKGGGWYNDLYSSPKPGKDDGGGASEKSDKGEGKSEGGGWKGDKPEKKKSDKKGSKGDAKASKAAA